MGDGFVTDDQQPTCSKTLKTNHLPPISYPPAAQVVSDQEQEESVNNYAPILAPTPSTVPLYSRANGTQSAPPNSMSSTAPPATLAGHDNQHGFIQSNGMPSRARVAPPRSVHQDNGHFPVTSFRDAFPDVYEQRYSGMGDSWCPRTEKQQQGPCYDQSESSRYYQPRYASYQNQGSNYSTYCNSEHSYANSGAFSTDQVQQAHKPCMATDIFSFLKTCVHQLDVALTNGPASNKLSSCVNILEEIRSVIIGGEDRFKNDLILNGHKGHDYTYCSMGELRRPEAASTQVEQELPTATNPGFQNVTSLPPQNPAMEQ